MSDPNFINYRHDTTRHDTATEAQRLAPSLRDLVGPDQVFRETSSMDDGRAFPDPRRVPVGPEALDSDVLTLLLDTDLANWTTRSSPASEGESKIRVELFREFQFTSFIAAVGFMNLVAPGCDLLNHHPRWENTWKTVRVFLSTWEIGHRISDRDVQLARYLDRAYSEYAGAVDASHRGDL